MKLSIVLPVAAYNLEWVDKAIDSTVGVGDELIVVTDRECRGHFIPDPRITHLMTVDTKGLARALNAGIAAATGDFISFLCSDDYYDKLGMNRVQNIANETGGKYDIYGGMTAVDGYLGNNIWPKSGDIINLEHQCVITSPALFKKSLWWKAEGYSDVRYLDWHFWKKCIAVGATYHFTQIVMYHYHAWPGTISARYGYQDTLGHEWGNGPKER